MNKKFNKIALCAIITFAALQTQAQAQAILPISGTVTDASPASAYFNETFGTAGNDRPIANALVQIKYGDNLLASHRALTDAEGNFGTGQNTFRSAAIDVPSVGQIYLIVRKAGYLPDTTLLDNLNERVVNVSLVRDPLERRIDSVMAMMNQAEKIVQMIQPELGTPSGVPTALVDGMFYGSVLNGGDGHTPTFLSSMVSSLNTLPAGRARIPTYYGKDAVHGNAGVSGYTVFPHNIGLGATRDSALVRRIGEATAKEMWAANIDLNFSPAISVARDARWGRTYESYGENPELHVQLGAAMVRGLQGDRFNAPWRITATAKHYLGDGGTTNGRDRGNTVATDDELRAIHLPGYEAVVEQGILSVMASFNTIQNPGGQPVHQHVDSLRMTEWLKTELAFDGYIISDWNGIANSTQPGYTQPSYGWSACKPGINMPPSLNPTAHTLTREAVRRAINGGIDLAMEPEWHADFRTHLTSLVNDGQVPMSRIDDAVRRILRAKFRAGRMDNFAGPSGFVNNSANRNHADHRAIAREAVAKSQVLLKNDGAVLPLAKNASIHVFGSHSDNIGLQSGGWTITWQGADGNDPFAAANGVSILGGMRQVSGQTSFAAAANADVIVYVTGESPTYAEWCGDVESLNFTPSTTDMNNLATYRQQGKKIVTIFVTGRPRTIPALIEASDAFLVAWLPGTEGGGVADVLFGEMPFTGRLPFTWQNGGGTPNVYAYDFGLITPITPAAPVLVAATETSVTLVHNPNYEYSNDGGETWQTSAAFTELEEETEYEFIQRVRASVSATGVAGDASPSLVVTTSKTSIQEIARDVQEVDDVAVVAPSPRVGVTISAGPNPVDRNGGAVNFYIDGNVEISRGDFVIYDVTGNVVRRLRVDSNSNVVAWDLQDARGRLVSEGTYLVRGALIINGKRESVSTLIGVR